ncbi:Autophagy-related protein 27 [Wickerhamiella sorbophila]|uniref:Autophagy-related protein 27 n=1 Tax=Wickerhamiella sorbophila TaxID=45607 RepID=A0A2T0FJW6_9ASCO|nr:Autophagy-related protein 27 [Wickerhamiella sorbophila]PRT55281.1 Autophagy-related protein 27 [Wickerhamiella sorbophila]
MRFIRFALAGTALALPGCKNIKVDNEKYDLSDLAKTWIISEEIETPPTLTNLTWYYNPCGAIEESNCPPKSQLCGVERVTRDGTTEITQIIPIYSDGENASRAVEGAIDENAEGIRFIYSGATWGDKAVSAEVVFNCGTESKYVSGADTWENESLLLTFTTPSVCADRSEKPRPPPSEPDESRGFFGSIFHFFWMIFVYLLVLALIVGVILFIRYRQTGQAPVYREDLESLLRDLPYLIRDFFRKIRETFGGSSRGYAAL